MRPSVAEIQAAGGVSAFRLAAASRRHPNGSESSYEHDCWQNCSGPGDYPSGNDGQFEHAVGIQNETAYGLLSYLSVWVEIQPGRPLIV
ncbi:MAG TPA: hypothetical protein VIJ96_08160 [Acidothermaceae bacterium]